MRRRCAWRFKQILDSHMDDAKHLIDKHMPDILNKLTEEAKG